MVLYGKFLLHCSQHGAIGIVTTGDSLGEEGLFEKSDAKNPIIRRKEIATAEDNSFVLELNQHSFDKLKQTL